MIRGEKKDTLKNICYRQIFTTLLDDDKKKKKSMRKAEKIKQKTIIINNFAM